MGFTDAAQKVALTKELERAKDKLESRLAALEADIHRTTLAAKVLAQRKGNNCAAYLFRLFNFSINRLVRRGPPRILTHLKWPLYRVSFLGIRL